MTARRHLGLGRDATPVASTRISFLLDETRLRRPIKPDAQRYGRFGKFFLRVTPVALRAPCVTRRKVGPLLET